MSEKAKEEAKEREAKDKAKEEREKEYLTALGLLAQKVDNIGKSVVGIETALGVGKEDNNGRTTMLDRLQNIEMDVGEWLEKVRDPAAAGKSHAS